MKLRLAFSAAFFFIVLGESLFLPGFYLVLNLRKISSLSLSLSSMSRMSLGLNSVGSPPFFFYEPLPAAKTSMFNFSMSSKVIALSLNISSIVNE